MSWKAAALLAVALSALVIAARLTQGSETGTASWDATRAAGFGGYVLLWASVVVGVALHMRWRLATLTWILEAHRMTSVLALAFVAGHITGLLVDPVEQFAPWEAAVPLLSGYRPLQVGFGIVALWLITAVLVTTAVASRIPYAVWRRSHYLAFPAYVLTLLHGITAGTDSADPRAIALYASTASILTAAIVWRLGGRGWTTAAQPES